MIISIEGTTVTLNGLEIPLDVEGWSEDSDALTMPDAFEHATVRRGATGKMAVFPTGDRGGAVTIKLLPNAHSTKVLMQQAALSVNGSPTVWEGNIQNNELGFSFKLSRGVMTVSPLGQTMGKGEVANQIFTFEFEEIVPNYDAVVSR